MQYLQAFQLLLHLDSALLFLVQFRLKSCNPAACGMLKSTVAKSIDAFIVKQARYIRLWGVCYTDLSSAVLSKLILGTAAEALLAGLESGKAGVICEIALTTGLTMHETRQLKGYRMLPMG